MSLLKMFDKLDDIIYKPIETVCDFVKEPIRRWEHKRGEEIKDNDVKREVERKTAISRIYAELEEMKKDNDLRRKKEITEAIIGYQEELVRLNEETISNLGHIMIQLRGAAQDFVIEKTQQYKELQKEARQEAIDQFRQIEEEFGDNEVAKRILYQASEECLMELIKTASSFTRELSEDIKTININLNQLAQGGNEFIKSYLSQLSIGSPVAIEASQGSQRVISEG